MQGNLKSRSELWTLLPEFPVVAEIGTAEGLFSRDILRDWKASKLFSVDNWGKIQGQTGDGGFENDWHNKNFQNVQKLLTEFGSRSVILRGISWDMAAQVQDESLDLVYIDCCHTYECVKNDLNAWYPKVKKGGIVAGHDINNPTYGVKQAVEEFCYNLDVNYTIIFEHGPDASFYFYKP